MYTGHQLMQPGSIIPAKAFRQSLTAATCDSSVGGIRQLRKIILLVKNTNQSCKQIFRKGTWKAAASRNGNCTQLTKAPRNTSLSPLLAKNWWCEAFCVI